MNFDLSTGAGLRIGLSDSGVGGLCLLPSLRQRFPRADFIYCCDNGLYPYGIQPDAIIKARMQKICKGLVEQHGLHILAVACNTAATIALDLVRETVAIPVVGVVPAIKTAAQLTQTGVFGLLATQATVRRPYTDQLISDFASHCRVLRRGSTVLVDLAEAKLRGKAVDVQQVRDEIAELVADPDLDAIVLGCTHFSHLVSELQQACPRPIALIDSTEAIVRRIEALASTLPGIAQPAITTGTCKLIFTKASDPQFDESTKKLWQAKFGFLSFTNLSI